MFVVLVHLVVLVVFAILLTCWFLAKKESFKTWIASRWTDIKAWFVETLAAVKSRISDKKAK